MNKLNIFAAAALALLALSCSREIIKEDIHTADPDMVVFTAGAPTKTAIDANDVAVTWVAGDEVKFVWEGGEYTATAETSGPTTTFHARINPTSPELYAVYPASAAVKLEEGQLKLYFKSSLSDGEFSSAGICIARSVNGSGGLETNLSFKNVATIVKVGVTDASIKKLQVKSVGDEAIVGKLYVSIDDGGNLVVGESESVSEHATLNIETPGDYYFPIFPGVTMSDGFRVNLFTDEETQITPFYYYGSFTTVAGQILRIAEIESRAGQYYVTPAGAGDKSGRNWANALDVENFKAFVTNQDNHFLLKGSTFHFSAEEFSFGDDYLKLNYPDHGNVAFTLEGTFNSESSMTTFLGRTDLSSDKAGILWPQSNSYLTVKNVKFTGTNGKSNYSAIRLNSGARELNLDHCYFDGNQTSGNGSGISLFNSATVNISNCVFKNATGGGGVIHVNNASANVNIQDSEVSNITKNAIFGQAFNTFTCTRVTFSDNNDAGEYGAAAYLCGSGTISFNDCDFIRNHSSDRGGAICIRPLSPNPSTSVTCTFTDCEFIDNWSDKRGGAVMIENCTALTTFNGGKFQGNYANGAHNTEAAGAAIYAIGSFSCTGVLFKENHNYVGTNELSGGIIRVQKSGEAAYFDNCVFDGNYTNRENSKNPPCAAIVNCRVGGVNFYFNACEFKENTSGVSNDAGRYGGLRGTVFATLAGSTFAFNNCSFHDNYGGRNSDDISWIGMDNTSSSLILANTTIAGDNYRAPETGAGRKNNWGVIKFQNTGHYYFLNSIVCSLDPAGNSFWVNGDIMVDGTTKISAGGPKLPVYCWYSKISKEGDDRTNWTVDTGSGHDYYATADSFGGWTAPYIWNGSLTGTNSDMLAATSDVNAQIQNADADFYAWLNSIGALGKDINGNSRGTTSWPGCYQAN